MVGDIVLICTGGTPPAVGSVIPTANVTVSFVTNVTSRLLSYSSTQAGMSSGTSEALLLIDEPGSITQAAVTGWGPGASQIMCGTTGASGYPYSAGGAGGGSNTCPEYAQQVGGEWVMSNSATGVTAGTNNGANMFAGVVNANQVIFYGIPVLPPSTAGAARIYRITNVRVNAQTLGTGAFNGTSQVTASVQITGGSLPINQAFLTTGFVEQSLQTSVRKTDNSGTLSLPQNLSLCNAQTVGPFGILRFQELFGTAFKTRVTPNATAGSGQGQNLPNLENTPGQINNSESGFITNLVGGTSNSAIVGLADYGTRLQAVFNNVPPGARIFVSTTNVTTLTAAGVTAPVAGNSVTSYAQLVLSSTALDGSTGGGAPTLPATGTISGGPSYVEITPASGSTTATAVWEVINTNWSASEPFDFGVWVTYTTSTAAASSPLTVNMSYAPLSTVTAASSSATIPRFVDQLNTPANLFTLGPCVTTLLFPFITNQVGFDTGIAIMNTTSDPFGTTPKSGTCTLNFYGQNAPSPYPTAVIGSGNSWTPATGAWMANSIAPTFEGYMIAVCNFPLAHGYAFISDPGAQKVAMGYLALVINTVTNGTASTGGRSFPEMLEN
jgi:hypothetical protein